MVRENPDANMFFENVEFTADHRNRGDVLIQLWFRNKSIWQHSLGLKEAVDNPYTMSDDAFKSTISKAMRDHLNVVSQMHLLKLDKHFPNSIKEVNMSYDVQRAARKLHVVFKNGHVAECYEHEAKTDDFMARCTMLYDLPSL